MLRSEDADHSVALVEVVEDEGVVWAVVKDRIPVVLVLNLHQEETRRRQLRTSVIFDLKHTHAEACNGLRLVHTLPLRRRFYLHWTLWYVHTERHRERYM